MSLQRRQEDDKRLFTGLCPLQEVLLRRPQRFTQVRTITLLSSTKPQRETPDFGFWAPKWQQTIQIRISNHESHFLINHELVIQICFESNQFWIDSIDESWFKYREITQPHQIGCMFLSRPDPDRSLLLNYKASGYCTGLKKMLYGVSNIDKLKFEHYNTLQFEAFL